jgi:hypothetical protein
VLTGQAPDDWLDDREAHRYQRELLDDPLTPIPDDVRHSRVAETLRVQNEHTRTCRTEAAALGAKWREPVSISVTTEITKLKHDGFEQQRVLLRHAWRTLAGLQHGNLSAILRVSSQDDAVVSPLAVTASPIAVASTLPVQGSQPSAIRQSAG